MNERKILHNIIRCRECKTLVVSAHCHDYRVCSCGGVAADGGNDYLRRATLRAGAEYDELTVYEDEGLDDGLDVIDIPEGAGCCNCLEPLQPGKVCRIVTEKGDGKTLETAPISQLWCLRCAGIPDEIGPLP